MNENGEGGCDVSPAGNSGQKPVQFRTKGGDMMILVEFRARWFQKSYCGNIFSTEFNRINYEYFLKSRFVC